MSEQNSDSQYDYIRGAIEALLIVSDKPLKIDAIQKALETVEADDIKKAIAELIKFHNERESGFVIQEIAGGYQILSHPQYITYVRNLYKTKHKDKLSKPALEGLAIIAYKQPVTRADIENIRGVNSDGVVANLLDRELIKIVGRKDVAGKPYLLGTTKNFLEYFGLKSLKSLPKLEEFPDFQVNDEGNELEVSVDRDAEIEDENDSPNDQEHLEEVVEGSVEAEDLEESKDSEEHSEAANETVTEIAEKFIAETQEQETK